MANKQKPLPNMSALQELHLALGFALQAAENYPKKLDKIKRLEALEEAQKERIFQLEVLLKGYEAAQPIRIEVCTKCLGAGAFMIKEEVEECSDCDGIGWKEKT